MSAAVRRPNPLAGIAGGIVAVSIKELRGRMRGRRAFVLLTIHLLAVSGFAFFIEEISVRSISPFGGGPQSADIGRILFGALLVFLTIVVLILAPASTSGAVSLEREKQTLDMLVTTPVSSLAIVLGKLVAALGWMALLLLASIPVMALVFMFGGVGPEDLLRAYIVLAATAVLYGSLGLFISALFKRTQASTVLNLVLAVVFSLGSGGVYGGLFLLTMRDVQSQANSSNIQPDWTKVNAPPPVLLWANPFAADMDVLCHAEPNAGFCIPVLVFDGRVNDAANGGNVGANGQGMNMPEDTYWPYSVATMLALSALLVLGTTQLISPTRRWRRPKRRRAGAGSAGGARAATSDDASRSTTGEAHAAPPLEGAVAIADDPAPGGAAALGAVSGEPTDARDPGAA